MTFKERIKQLRTEKDLTQIELAALLKYGRTAISNYESGRSYPSFEDLVRMADYFNVSVDYLLGKTDIREPYKKTEEFPQNVRVMMRDAKELTSDQLDIVAGIIRQFKESQKKG